MKSAFLSILILFLAFPAIANHAQLDEQTEKIPPREGDTRLCF